MLHPSPSLAHILYSISCACLYSKHDTKTSRTVEEFLLCGLTWRCCDERTQQQKGLWIMKHMWPSPPRTERGETYTKRKGWLESQLSWCDTNETDIRRRHAEGDGWNVNFIKPKWERPFKSETAAPLLNCALLLTGTGGGTCNCTWKRIQKKRKIYLCICLKTRLCLIHPTQVAERSLCKIRATPLLL